MYAPFEKSNMKNFQFPKSSIYWENLKSFGLVFVINHFFSKGTCTKVDSQFGTELVEFLCTWWKLMIFSLMNLLYSWNVPNGS
jgi:hypothetical protein